MTPVDRVIYFFTPYTDSSERAVGRFFKGLNERKWHSRTRSRLLKLLQSNIAVINLWTEYRYKGYRYLRKAERRKLYDNLRLISDDFDRFYIAHARPAESVMLHIQGLAPHVAIGPERVVLLQALCDYFAPGRGVYVYRDSSSFGRLLRDPARDTLVGDCNQIVTLYVYLYSRYFDVRDLQIRRLPEHVALHCGGVDIETTSGTFANYGDRKGSALLPIEEIVSINLLDTTDAYLSRHEITPEDFLYASRLAFVLSHDRDIARHNLTVAYRKLVNALMAQGSYRKALAFARSSSDLKLLGVVGNNGAVHAMERQKFAEARRFAKYAPDRDRLVQNSWRNEGIYLYEAHRYKDAIKAFEQSGSRGLVRKCYEALFFEEQDKLGSTFTAETIKKNSGTIKRMRAYAKKSGNKKLATYASDLQRHV